MIVKCSAKINLFFNIIGIDKRGYHLVHAINQSISLFDVLDINIIDSSIKITCNNNEVPVDSKNSVYKAAKAFFEYTKISSGVSINIEKNIPLMSGLGGESTDAAGVLIALNKLFNTKLSLEELIGIGYKVGCDVPFCIIGGTCEVSGCGEVVKPIDTVYNNFLIITPNIKSSTKCMFEKYDNLIKEYKKIPIEIGHNDFHKVLDNDILNIIKTVEENGAIKSFLTGSGSSVVGIFQSSNDLDIVYHSLQSIFSPTYSIVKAYSLENIDLSF